jgi:hypothetical protein
VDPATTAKAAESQAAEKRRIAEVRENLPPVETILGLDEFQVSIRSQLHIRRSLHDRDYLIERPPTLLHHFQ